MASERIDYNKGMKNSPNKYEKYLYYNVTLIMSDGSIFDGIIESVEEDHIIMLVGEDVMELDNSDDNTNNENRHYGNGPHNRRPRRRSRRFRRRPFPFPNIVAVELLPYIPPYPYPYPYPYY